MNQRLRFLTKRRKKKKKENGQKAEQTEMRCENQREKNLRMRVYSYAGSKGSARE